MFTSLIAQDDKKIKEMVSELLKEDALSKNQNSVLYKTILAKVEKPLIEQVLERTEGNQLKAARILGINRNTMRSKIKKLAIDIKQWKV